MNKKLPYVRPVMSLDAWCHLRGKHKGTLYIATVMSAVNEVYPVAFGITKENESILGWVYFLENLEDGCSILTTPNQKRRCAAYNNYVFLSDRDKGLVEGMKAVFPKNLHTHCLMHIGRNVQTKWRKIPWALLFNIGKSFDL